MKIDRRSFLGLGLGAVAGGAVSPAGIKLMDDLSIWTQNWPWTPVPPDGEVTYENSICSLCKGSCGITIKKAAGRAIKIEGQKDHPVNKGGICLHGISGLQYLYDPSRIKSPLIKKGGRFEKTSWDNAITLVAKKLAQIKDQKKPESLACISGNSSGSTAGLFKRFLKVFGSNQFYFEPSMDSTLDTIAEKMHGTDNTISYDIDNANCILSFGAGLIEGWGAPVLAFKANALRKEKKARLIQIEPRLSNTAASADKWLPVNPGTETDFALGLCNIIIKIKKDELYNIPYISQTDDGFLAFANLVEKEYTPEKVAQTTGIDLSVLNKIAHEFAWADKPIALPGKGRGDNAGDTREFAAVHALNALTGNINVKGGVWVKRREKFLNFPYENLDNTAKKGFLQPRHSSFNTLMNKLAKAETSSIQALFILNSNPCYTMHDCDKIVQAFQKIPFKVSFSSFMDETAKLSDIILPSHTFLERFEDIISSSAGVARKSLSLARPVVKPIFDTKNPGDAILMIAKALKGNMADNFPWENYEACLKSVLGDNFNPLNKKGWVILNDKAPFFKPPMDFSIITEGAGSPAIQGDKKSFPLTLIQIDNIRIPDGAVACSPFTVKIVSDKVIKGKDMLVEINPRTAEKLRLSHGDKAKITTPLGSAMVRINIFDGIMPGVIGMAQGLGHTLDNEYVAGKGVNVNKLIAPVIEPISGQDAAWGIAASISKV